MNIIFLQAMQKMCKKWEEGDRTLYKEAPGFVVCKEFHTDRKKHLFEREVMHYLTAEIAEQVAKYRYRKKIMVFASI